VRVINFRIIIIIIITAAAWTAGFHWWRSGNIMRMQNVSEYMFVLALCLVTFCAEVWTVECSTLAISDAVPGALW